MGQFFLEGSATAIYDRIARAMGRELARRGKEVMLIQPAAFHVQGFQDFLRSRATDDVYVSMTGANLVQRRPEGAAEFFFELFRGPIVFVHQDAILGGIDFDTALARLQAYKRVAHRAWHLCIEPDTVAALQAAGIEGAGWVPHASEFAPAEPLDTAACAHAASFVGHVLPSAVQPRAGSAGVNALMEAALHLRREHLGAPVQPLLQRFADRAGEAFGPGVETAALRVAHVHWLRSQFTTHTMPFRGWVLEQADLPDLTVFGGDPAYLHRVDRCLTLPSPGVTHRPAVYDPAEVQALFRRSACSVNISSLQFDHAVVNRVHDVFMAGGLCLTDALGGVATLTREHAEISFRSPEELRERAAYFADPRNSARRTALIRAVQQDLLAHTGYGPIGERVLEALQRLQGPV